MAATATRQRRTNQRSRRNMPAAPAPPTPAPTDLVERLIRRAKELEAQRQDIFKTIEANRRTLRDLDKQEMLDADQGAWLDSFYPVKSKDSKRTDDEVEATRKIRAAAVAEIRGSANGGNG